MKFAIDAFGGDNAPEAVIRGSIDAMQLNDDFSIIFTGDESAIYALLNDYESVSYTHLTLPTTPYV